MPLLIAQATPNLTGVLLMGDSDDFEELYDAIHKITSEEDTPKEFYEVRIRVLSLCYDLRHAKMGNRNAFFKSHGLSTEQMAHLSLVGPTQNLYLSFETLFPEILFEVFALEDFIQLYMKRTKTYPWNLDIVAIRKFQAQIVRVLEELLTPRQISSFKKAMNPTKPLFKNFFSQYVDLLNMNWIRMSKSARQKNLSIYVKRLTQLNEEYEVFKNEILEAALEHDCHPSEIRINFEYPEEIEW